MFEYVVFEREAKYQLYNTYSSIIQNNHSCHRHISERSSLTHNTTLLLDNHRVTTYLIHPLLFNRKSLVYEY